MNDPTYVETWVDNDACYGHNPTDIQPFHDLFLSEGGDWSTAEDSTDNVTDDVMGGVTGGVTGDVTDDVTGDVPDNVTGAVTGDVTHAVTDAMVDDVTADVTNEASAHAVTDAVTNNVTDEVVADVTADVKREVTDGDAGGITPVKTYYTNKMLYDLLAPDGMSIPYIYDNFEWQHCDVSC